MPKKENIPGEIVYTPLSWQVALSQFLQEMTALAKVAREALEVDIRKQGGR